MIFINNMPHIKILTKKLMHALFHTNQTCIKITKESKFKYANDASLVFSEFHETSTA